MRICSRCKSAENPKGKLSFKESPEGSLCSGCYSRYYSSPPAKAAPSTAELTVITCPECRGKHHAPRGNQCNACVGYGVVRVVLNALAVYVPARPEKPESSE